MDDFYQVAFWVAVLKIIWINILLSGDWLAVVIASCATCCHAALWDGDQG